MIVTVTANPGLDLTYVLPSSDDGDVRRADRSTIEASGKGVNVSRALTLAGQPSCAVFPCGGHSGILLRALLEQEGVPYRATAQAGDLRVNTTGLSPGGHTMKLNGPGSPLTHSEQDALVGAVADALRGARDPAATQTPGGPALSPVPTAPARWLAVCGSLPPQTDTGLIRRLVALAHEHGARCAVDVSGPALGVALKAGADLLAPNRHELGEVSPAARDLTSLDGLAHAADDLARRAGTQLLVSLGPDGALYSDGNTVLHAQGPPLVPVNTAGAGDALLAGWLLAEGDPAVRLQRAVRWGRSACLSETTVDLMPGRRDSSPITVRTLVHARDID